MSNNFPLQRSSSRRAFIAGAGAIGATILGGAAPTVLAKTTAPLRIGVLNSFSKVFAALANANLNGMNLYFEQYLRQSKAFTLCSGAGVAALSYTQLPYFFRCSVSTFTVHQTMGEWFYDNVAKEVVLSASDFAGGRGSIAEFKLGFLPKGGKIIQEIYPPLGNNDFSSYLALMRNANAPATFSFYAGTDAVRFVKQYDEYGLKQRSRLTGSGFMLDSDTLPAQGRSALGAINALHYADTLDNAANKKFVADYRKKYNEYPSVYSEYGYIAAQVLHAALQAVDGNTEDKDRLRAAMIAVRLNAPRGPFRFNAATQSPTQNVYIREVAEIDGRIANKVIHTIQSVQEPANRPY